MGLYDREYIRTGRRLPSGLGVTRMWSVNTWIIIINVAVFVLDIFLLSAVGPVDVKLQKAYVASATVEQRDRAETQGQIRPSTISPSGRSYALVDPATGQIVGEQFVMVMQPLNAVGHFSTFKALAELQVWRFITFQFLHHDVNHLFFNMLGLFFFGGLVENYLGRKRYLAYYLTTGTCGAFLYLVLNLLGQSGLHVPALLINDISTPLIGASAGVFGVLMAGAYVAPNAMVLFLFILSMRMATLVYALVGVAALTLISSGPNAGGEAAHLGGAISGFFLIRNTHVLRDIISVFSFGARSGGGPKRVVHRSARPSQVEIDRILEKVSERGLDSLSDSERRTLHRASHQND
jgi:membrane associated rhomboid family serine protease